MGDATIADYTAALKIDPKIADWHWRISMRRFALSQTLILILAQLHIPQVL
jgi:hypothetical protein